MPRPATAEVADALVRLYDRPFGGKDKGRFRVSDKIMRRLTGRKRLSEAYIAELSGELFERGYVLVDLETFYAVIGAATFNSYRRLGETQLAGTRRGARA